MRANHHHVHHGASQSLLVTDVLLEIGQNQAGPAPVLVCEAPNTTAISGLKSPLYVGWADVELHVLR